ncbi:hypothetical protein [Roseateles sp. PN1]|uniref:hypothetical protein n=1 Tax=Roseateles sp. PN1 TaxID=3137372 RepID=UPI0031391C93
MTIELDDSIGFEEPGNEAPAVTAAKDRNALAITADLDRVKTALNEFDRVSAGLAELEARYPKDVVYPVETPKGYKDAIEHRAAWRDPRILVEKSRKMAKAPILTLGKSIDARAAWLTEKLEEGEKPVDQQIKAEDARREAVKQARINAEAGRIIAIQEALAEIGQNVLIACSKTSVEVRALSVQMHETRPDPEVFQEMIEQAKEAWAAGIVKLETALKAKLWDEAEQARLAEERAAEEERRKQAAAAIEAQRLENERIAAEQRAAAEAIAAQQRALEAQAAALAAQQKAIDDAKAAAERAEADRIAREARAAEQAKLDAIAAEHRRAQEAEAAARRAAEEQERARRAAAIAAQEAAQLRLHNAAQKLLDALILAVPFVTDGATLAKCNEAIDEATERETIAALAA